VRLIVPVRAAALAPDLVRAALKTLPGIGDAEARKIIAGRPWLTKADLVTKGVLAEGRYVAIRNRIVAANPGGPAQAR
jgi:radical SAM superfamily enzyme with C-terminal helix-hairpin-helix motif